MSYLSDQRVRWIVVHYSATAIEADVSMEDIDDMHRRRGFRETGYHFYIKRNGRRFEGRDLTRPGLFEMGAHSQGENDASVGICYEGGVRRADPNKGLDTRTPEQTETLIETIYELLARFPEADVVGHRDMPGAKTQCPGFDATLWWNAVERDGRNRPIFTKQRGKLGLIDRLVAFLKGLFK